MSTLEKTRVTVSKYAGNIGAVISGVDIATETDPAVYDQIVQAFSDYGVLFLRDQKLTPEQYVAFGARFGELVEPVDDKLPTLPGFSKVQQLIKEADSKAAVGEMWHTDQAYRPHPTKGTMLRSIETPPYGGDTCFLNAAAAFDALSEPMKELLRPLRGIHSRPYIMRNRRNVRAPELDNLDKVLARNDVATHPVVTKHPVTGREILYITPGYTCNFEGWSEAESAPLLKQLFEHCTLPEFQCRFIWQPNSIAVWDNRQVWHYAVNDYHGHRREMHRLMIQ